MQRRKNSQLWDYLDASGVLERGSDAEIKAVKRAYRKKYFLEFKRTQRKAKPEFTVRLSKSNNNEYSRIATASQKHQLSVPAFLKAAALAYLDRTYIVPNRLMVASLEQLLSDCLNEIKSISVAKERWWEWQDKLSRIEKCITRLESQTTETFRNPTLYDHKNKIP